MSHAKNYVDISGKRFGKLTAIKPIGQDKSRSMIWECICDCGGIKHTTYTRLRRGECLSCGCLQRESTGNACRKHGGYNTKLYKVWSSMKQRCMNSNNNRYSDYGGRGITVCKEWMDFTPFKTWAFENGYNSSLTLDRIDNNKGYSPQNCRFVTQAIQAKNKRSNHLITFDGETKTVTEWSKYVGMNESALFTRLQRGWSIERALTQPVQARKKADTNGDHNNDNNA